MTIKNILQFRQLVSSSIRDFLYSHNYLEADVPVLVPSLIPESYLEVFQTTVTDPRGSSSTAFLTASPEAYLKRLLVENSGNIFYLGKAFRNGEPMGKTHNHEFTILEWYLVGANYVALMKQIEEMVQYIAKKLTNELNVKSKINYQSPWEYITVEEAYNRFAPTPFNALTPEQFEKDYVQYIEPNLGTRGVPTFLTDFPAWQSPLSKEKEQVADTILRTNWDAVSPRDRRGTHLSEQNVYQATSGIAERFELYINGVELINGWSELTDPKKQAENFAKEQDARKELGKSPIVSDDGFLTALEKGMPECAGAAMGVDRLLMVLGGYNKLEDVLLFPTNKLFTLS